MTRNLARCAGMLAAAACLALVDPTAIAHAPRDASAGAMAPSMARTVNPGEAPTSSTATPENPQPVGVPGNWKLKFQDNFSGTKLSLNKWRPNWQGAGDKSVSKNFNQREKSCYDPDQVTVRDGSLRLKAEKRTCRASTGETYKYASGVIQSSHDYKFTYGYAEARMYLPRNTDPKLGKLGACGPNWAAFWLNGDHWPTSGEIDVMECLGKDNVSWHYHWANGSAGGSPEEWKGKLPGPSDWHTFGVDWQPGSVTFYYNGKKVGRHTVGISSERHYLITNLSISGTKIKTPQTLKIDYIRVWKR